MVTKKYTIKPVEQTLAEQRARQQAQASNPTPTTTTSTAPKQTVQIKSPSGTNMTVGAGSQMHQNYLKNNPSAIDQSSVKTTYSTPDVYHYSDNVKQFDQNGQQTYSVSGYNGATTGYTASSNAQALVNQIKQQEAQMRNVWANGGGDYNALIRERNNLSGQLANLLTTESQGKASLADIESVLGRRLENQEMQAYREQFSNGSTLQQQQLNNLWEHDFATRNNGETYQYYLNYLNNGTGGDVLSESTRNYIGGLDPTSLANYTQSQADSLASTQNYFTQRADGWTPEYVNNTANPLPWGEVDAADVINNGGAQLQQQYQDYLWTLANPNYDYSTMTPSPLDIGGQSPINLNVTNQTSGIDMSALSALMNSQKSSGIDITALMGLLNTQQTPSQQINPQGNLSMHSTQDDTLNKYLQQVFLGGI